jgi:hypothetical protein
MYDERSLSVQCRLPHQGPPNNWRTFGNPSTSRHSALSREDFYQMKYYLMPLTCNEWRHRAESFPPPQNASFVDPSDKNFAATTCARSTFRHTADIAITSLHLIRWNVLLYYVACGRDTSASGHRSTNFPYSTTLIRVDPFSTGHQFG